MKTTATTTTKNCSTTTTTTTVIPILPLTKSVKYSHRPTSHLTLARQKLTPAGLPLEVTMNYLSNSYNELKKENLYPFRNYQIWYESAVTHMWIAILEKFNGQEITHFVMDGGMNTGFYTTLTAVMGFEVHSFDLQLDCFDVARLLLNGNQVDANLYHIGLADSIQVVEAGEGCFPGYSLQSTKLAAPPSKFSSKWKQRRHQVMLLPLDIILDQIRGNRKIALIKLDLEGAEILALRGLQRHLHAVQHFIMEISPRFSAKMGITPHDIREQLLQLEVAGFRSYLLWLPQIQESDWFNATSLEHSGVKNAEEHPVLGANFTIGMESSAMLWEIVDYDKLFANTCTDGCNLFFARMQ